MTKQVREYIDKYPSEIIDMYNTLRKLIFLKQDIPVDVLRQIFAETLG